MVGMPGQDWYSLGSSLETLVALEIQHISLYCLSLEPGTPLALRQPEDLPDEDAQAELFESARSFLTGTGFTHYEISNFARPGYECQHNLNYWRGGEYAGLGPSAASHLQGKRYKNRDDLDAYLKNPNSITTDEEELPPPEKAAEEAMTRLRLVTEGLDYGEIARRYGTNNLTGLRNRLEALAADGELLVTTTGYRLPPDRILTSNPVFSRVLGD
jgi:oxygen-independent coproporphyrinogen-3 oxidase